MKNGHTQRLFQEASIADHTHSCDLRRANRIIEVFLPLIELLTDFSTYYWKIIEVDINIINDINNNIININVRPL